MPQLEIRGLAVAYGPVEAVRSLDVSVTSGEITVLLGANGAGKSSALGAIAGALPKVAGTVTLDGTELGAAPSYRVARAGVVLVPEGRRIFAPLTVEENLQLGAYTNRSKRQKEQLEHVYELFPILRERRHGRGGLLSGGEQQMLAFGRAIMADPRIILMDEPSMGLSPVMVDTIMAAIARIAADGIGVLMAEQNAVAALEIAHRVLVLTRGEVLLAGSPAEVERHPDVIRAFLGDLATEVVEEPVAEARER